MNNIKNITSVKTDNAFLLYGSYNEVLVNLGFANTNLLIIKYISNNK